MDTSEMTEIKEYCQQSNISLWPGLLTWKIGNRKHKLHDADLLVSGDPFYLKTDEGWGTQRASSHRKSGLNKFHLIPASFEKVQHNANFYWFEFPMQYR